MKYQSRVSTVLALSLFISMLSFPSATQAQPRPNRFSADTGVVYIGGTQVLRVTVNGMGGADAIRVRFTFMKYMPAGCNNDGVCRHTVESQGETAPVLLEAGEAASLDVQGTGAGVRVLIQVITANNAVGARATLQLIDGTTGKVISWMDTDLFT